MSKLILICTDAKQGRDYCRENDISPSKALIIPYERFNGDRLMGLELRGDNFRILDPFIQTLLTRIR